MLEDVRGPSDARSSACDVSKKNVPDSCDAILAVRQNCENQHGECGSRLLRLTLVAVEHPEHLARNSPRVTIIRLASQ